MHPLDLQAERERRHAKAFRALARDIRQAALQATPAEVIGLNALLDDCQARRITAAEAHRHVARLRDLQRDRLTVAA